MNQQTSRHSSTILSVTNGVLGLLLAGMLSAFLYIEFLYEPNVEPADIKPYVQEVRQRLDDHADVISEEAALLVSDTWPPLSDAFYQQTTEDYPLILQTLQTQSDEYLANSQEMLVAKVQAKYKDYLQAHRVVLEEEFPEHASKEKVERVLAEFEQTFDRLSQRYYVDEFQRETNRTKLLWNKFEPVAQPGPNDPSLGEQLADYTADWTIIALAEESEVESGEPSPGDDQAQTVRPEEP